MVKPIEKMKGDEVETIKFNNEVVVFVDKDGKYALYGAGQKVAKQIANILIDKGQIGLEDIEISESKSSRSLRDWEEPKARKKLDEVT